MRVKRLEIQGFKSFKDKTVIHFDHSITGIVGPNGCGKSNIVDAFFWVMGEQSYKHMRGSGSEDLIFNGSSKYAPLGIAEATLVMETDATDGGKTAPAGATAQDIPLHLRAKEIAVTRRVYRSGEGEYFINGVPARLKDIQELFMDTGVGAKGYSVIEQGQIGKIVNAKPEERRLLVEEAAGIAKYKARKKESLRKMEATQANLSRLTDVLQEIERNLASLERQAQKARLYKKYKDELLDKEMTWGRRKHRYLRQKLDALRKDRDAREQELLALKSELQITENTIEADRVILLTDTKNAEELQSKVQELSAALTRQQSALELSHRRQGDLENQLRSMETERTSLQKEILSEKSNLNSLEIEARESEHAFKGVSEKALAMEEQVRQARSEAEVERSRLESEKKAWTQNLEASSAISSQAASLASRIEAAHESLKKTEQQARLLADKLQSARLESENANRSVHELHSQQEILQQESEKLSAEAETLEQKIRQTEKERDELSHSLTKESSRLQSLKELEAAHEGFGDGPRSVLDWSKTQNNPIEALADGLEVPQEYEAALQGWLGSRVEHLISENSKTAVEALENLRSQKQGRASIHIAQAAASGAAKTQDIRSRLESSGFVVLGELSEFAKINHRLSDFARTLAQEFLNQVYVVQSFAPVTDFLSSQGIDCLNSWSLVSLSGEVLDPAGLLRGGSTEDTTAASLLARKRVISELELSVSQAQEKLGEREKELHQHKQELNSLKTNTHALQAKKQTLEIQGAALERDLYQAEKTVQEITQQLELVTKEKETITKSIQTDELTLAETKSKLTSIASSRTEKENQIKENENDLTGRDVALREQEAILQSLRVDEASLRERVFSLKKTLESAKNQITERERRLGDLNRQLERAFSEQEYQSGGDTQLKLQIEQLTHTLGQAQEELSSVKNRIEQTNAKTNAAMDRIKELHQGSDEKTTSSTQLALETEKFSGELSFLIQNLEEKYGPGCLEKPIPTAIQEEMPEPIVTLEMSAEEEQILGEQVERLRERIRRLGEVNTLAINEYDDLKKRYDYLSTEKADLERSIENLKEAIEFINKTSEERFKKAFEAIADRFEKLFPIIFGGGQANLSLVYPEGSSDILEAGVDILAQPPGKKISNITLLSGGEKALTAVALIFAIFMVKPSPFCVLDEVDAPLDDANIGKFNALLREMAAHSQFILITHNKKTMELNDTLYGVTMEEPGVSKMVSIEMR